MKYTTPIAANKGMIRKLFEETFAFRRKEVDSLTITDFLSLYPRTWEMPELVRISSLQMFL